MMREREREREREGDFLGEAKKEELWKQNDGCGFKATLKREKVFQKEAGKLYQKEKFLGESGVLYKGIYSQLYYNIFSKSVN